MNLFNPENLSPLPTPLLACQLPYGLTWDDLLPVLPRFNARRHHLARAFASHRKQGLNGGENSIILTLLYPGGEDELLSQIVFAKSQNNPLHMEAEKYRYLAAHGVPIPRLLAGLRKEDAEVIVLEFLPKIGIDFTSPGEANDLLHLAAMINSLPISAGLFEPEPGMPQDEFDRLVEDALRRMAKNPAIPPVDVPRWLAAYLQCHDEAEQMPPAVNHNQFFFQQVGWTESGAGHRLVIFDLETMCTRPRFTDLAGILYALSRFSGRTQEDLLLVYLEALRLQGRHPPDLAGALRELRILRIAEMCASLPWLSGEAAGLDSFDAAGSLSMAAECLRDDLAALALA